MVESLAAPWRREHGGTVHAGAWCLCQLYSGGAQMASAYTTSSAGPTLKASRHVRLHPNLQAAEPYLHVLGKPAETYTEGTLAMNTKAPQHPSSFHRRLTFAISLTLEHGAHKHLNGATGQIGTRDVPLACRLAHEAESASKFLLRGGSRDINLVAEHEDGCIGDILVREETLWAERAQRVSRRSHATPLTTPAARATQPPPLPCHLSVEQRTSSSSLDSWNRAWSKASTMKTMALTAGKYCFQTRRAWA